MDFRAKKDELEVPGGKRYARKLSGFAYALFLRLRVARAYREGVGVMWVNPAFTTVIGYANRRMRPRRWQSPGARWDSGSGSVGA